ncbi:MAG: MFS transporter, partial [Proteobacteria bacterium]|nr:MFS transporter [Pseudomonadota bacterium]
PRYDWLQDDTIAMCAAAMVVGAIVFFWRAFTAEEPIVNLRAFTNRNFAFGSAFSFVMGIGLYGLTYLYPVYLSRIRGYDSLMIGETMFVTGLTMFFMAPVAGRLSQILDLRVMMVIGFTGFSLGTLMASRITVDWDFWELLWPQLLRGGSLMLCMVPINNLSLGTLSPPMLRTGAGLYNLMRNLGGAVGLALINTELNNRTDLHLERLREAVHWGRPVAEDTLAALTTRLSSLIPNGDLAALKQMSLMLRRQATVMAFSDVFLLLTVVFASLMLFAFLMRKPAPVPASAGGGH